ncbi:hypothetical protein B6U74_04425 [Candidatus Bathyarchaeota archaeon ex4484_205]|nr:MAG: hypothetical protein B6U74_04425 [Candidatus Bathyarchaeota archaeon ex4484_205]
MVRRLSSYFPGILSVIVAILLLYFSFQTFKTGDIVSGIILIASMIIAGLIVVVGLGIGLAYEPEIRSISASEDRSEEILKIYVARQKAMLEQLDECVELLKEIRDLLKGVGQ